VATVAIRRIQYLQSTFPPNSTGTTYIVLLRTDDAVPGGIIDRGSIEVIEPLNRD
jgi:hypothetical protein